MRSINISSTIETTQFQFGTPVQYSTVEINADKIVGILDIIDSGSGDKWYEVDYLGQEMVYDSIKNTNTNDPNLSQYSGDTPYILKLEKIISPILRTRHREEGRRRDLKLWVLN